MLSHIQYRKEKYSISSWCLLHSNYSKPGQWTFMNRALSSMCLSGEKNGSCDNPRKWKKGNWTPVPCVSRITSARCRMYSTIPLLPSKGKSLFYSQSSVAL